MFPISNDSFISGIYDKPYWIIEFETNVNTQQNDKTSRKLLKSIAYLSTTEESTPRYMTRSVTTRNKSLNESKTNEQNQINDQIRDVTKDIESLQSVLHNNECNVENETIANNDEEARCIENEKSVINTIFQDHCNFGTTI